MSVVEPIQFKSSYNLCQIFNMGGFGEQASGEPVIGSVYRLINEDGHVWESAGKIIPRAYHICSHITTSAGEDRVIVVGGSWAGSQVEIYNPKTGVTRRAGNGWIST